MLFPKQTVHFFTLTFTNFEDRLNKFNAILEFDGLRNKRQPLTQIYSMLLDGLKNQSRVGPFNFAHAQLMGDM